MKQIYTVAIIGAGRIGAGFDDPKSRAILSHAHAFSSNPRTKLVGLVEADAARGRKEAARWKTEAFPDIERLYTTRAPDIIVIATPDKTHMEFLEAAARRAPRLIVCEKPILARDEDASRVRALAAGPVPVIVNFSRRFDATVVRLAAELKAGAYGRVLSASGIYTKGIFHNGSHLLDVARFLFGEMRFARAESKADDLPGGAGSVAGFASFEGCPQFHLVCGDDRAYSIFELDILTEKKRFRFAHDWQVLTEERIIRDPLYPAFRALGKMRTRKTALVDALPELARHCVAVLDGKEKPRSTLENALKTHEACALFARGIKTL